MAERPQLLVRPLAISDLEQVAPILESWIRYQGEVLPEEIAEVLDSMRSSVAGSDRHYLVAEQDQVILGEVGLMTPVGRMSKFCLPDIPTVELTNFYVHPEHRGQGVGTTLFNSLKGLAASLGYGAMIWNSGPRYKDTAHGFYDRLPGVERVGELRHMYGHGAHAPVWRTFLEPHK